MTPTVDQAIEIIRQLPPPEREEIWSECAETGFV